MKRIIYFAAIVTLASFVACQKNEINSEDSPAEMQEFVFSATTENAPGSKATISGKTVTWDAGDKIRVYAFTPQDSGTYLETTMAGNSSYSQALAAGGTSEATFTFSLSSGLQTIFAEAGHYMAFFNAPTYTAPTFDKRGADLSVMTNKAKATIYFPGGGATGGGDFVAVQTNDNVQGRVALSSNNELSFKNLWHLIRFTTDCEGTAVISSNKNISAGATVEVLARQTLAVYFDSSTGEIAGYGSGNAVSTITRTLVPGGENYFALLPGLTLSEGFSIAIYDTNNVLVKTYSYDKPFTTVRNKITTIENFDSRIPLVGVQDLSSQMANCLVVSNSNTEYMFPAKNGSLADLTGVDHVSVLWETDNSGYQTTTVSVGDIITDVTYDSADNMIHFRTADNGKQGNALIVAYNSSNSVLWSWHIWRLAGGLKEVTLTTNHGESEQFLDRNLGAVSCNPADGVKTYGLYYQWGCKNPLLGGLNTGSVYAIKPVYAYAGTYCPNTKQRFASISSSSLDTYMKNPRYLYYDANEDTGSGLSAYYSPIQYYWQYSTGSVAYDNYQLFAAKGQNDPCPAGYAVSPGASNPRGCNDNGNTRPSESNIGQYCWWVGGVATDNGYLIDGSYFPLTGNINHNFGTIYADAVYLTAYYNQTSFFRFSGSNSGYYPVDNGTETLRTGGVVRCQKIQ